MQKSKNYIFCNDAFGADRKIIQLNQLRIKCLKLQKALSTQ